MYWNFSEFTTSIPMEILRKLKIRLILQYIDNWLKILPIQIMLMIHSEPYFIRIEQNYNIAHKFKYKISLSY